MERQRSLRAGIAAILCALLLRLWHSDLPEAVVSWLKEPNTVAFLIYLETGRDVRFSPSQAVFSPEFVESPPPVIPEPVIPVLTDGQQIDLYYGCKVTPDIQSLLEAPLEWTLREEEPTVLILHTHSTESYTKSGENYKETSRWRTLDEDYNMLAIGSRVGQLLSQGGIGVIQDRTLHDYPSYNGSYTHARASIRDYLEEYPSVRLVLDIHRDASGDAKGQMRTQASVDGKVSAQLMLVLGTNHKKYEQNLSLALKLHAWLEGQYPGIMRPLQLRSQRFNQDLSPGALIVEMGAAGNTHPEAMLAAEKLAEAILALSEGANLPSEE